MTEYQNALVVEHLGLVKHVIRTRFGVSDQAMLSYDDFYGVGCEAMCRAAMRYDPEVGEFVPFAYKFIYNAIIDHCRRVQYHAERTVGVNSEDGDDSLDWMVHTTVDFDGEIVDDTAMAALRACKERYSGVARKGVEAIELKMMGIGTPEIAQMYGTTVHNVNAWISRARSKLRQEPCLMETLV